MMAGPPDPGLWKKPHSTQVPSVDAGWYESIIAPAFVCRHSVKASHSTHCWARHMSGRHLTSAQGKGCMLLFYTLLSVLPDVHGWHRL
jgi:hypothetical protein